MSQAIPIIPDAAEAAALPERVKLQAIVGVERYIYPLFAGGFIVCIIGLSLGDGKKMLGLISHETVMVFLIIGGSLMAATGILWLLVDNYYVLDRKSRRIFLHHGLRFSGNEEFQFEGNQVTAIGLRCAELRGRYGQYGWCYKPILLMRNARPVELAARSTNMDGEKLPEYNSQTRLYAAALGCYWIECPPGQVYDPKEFFEKSNS